MRRTKQRLALAAAVVGLCLAGTAAAKGQQPTGTVVGQVTDAGTMKPLPSAQVFVPGTQRGALTNAEGRYVIQQVPVGARSIRVTVLGYAEATRAVTVAAGASVTANFALAQSAVELNAVVVSAVTGQAERKAQIGANVTNISVDAINKGQVSTFSDVLNGRTAGIDLQAVSGSIGTSQKIFIRGANSISLSNQPIMYVDGVLFDNSNTSFGAGGQDVTRMNDINPEDIANIEVLKGPAASSMYGTAAANGVLLITTKRGRAGKPVWHAYAETGSSSDKTNYPLNYLTYQLLKPGAPMTTATGALDKTARQPCYNYVAALGTCTQDSTLTYNSLRDPRTGPFITGFRNNFGLSLSGGTDQATYFISSDWKREQGVISFNTNNQINLRSNVDAHLRPNLDVSASFGYTTGKLSRNNNDNSVFSPLINGLTGGGFFYPNVTNADGTTKMNPLNFGFNYGVNDLAYFPILQDINHYVLGSTARWRPYSWLSTNAILGLDAANLHDYETLQPNSPLGSLAASYMIGFRDSRQSDNMTYSATGSAVASFDLRPDLNSSTTAGVQYTKNHLYGTEGWGYGIVAGTANLGAASSQYGVAELFSELIQIGAFAQEKLAYKDRVFVSGGVRTDDNSAFGKRYGRTVYPSASASWVISQEPFFPKHEWLSSLRLRTSWGASGLRPNFRQAVTYFNPVSTAVNGANLSSVTLQATGNDFLKPERTTEYEFGGDLALFQERVSLEATYFHKRSKDALVAKPLAPSLGLTNTMFDNLGSVQNKGLEFAVNALAVSKRDVRLNVRLSATTLDNKVLDLGSVQPYTLGRGNQRVVKGYSLAGFWQKPYTFNDANHDGKIAQSEVTLSSDTTQYIGPVLPKFSRTLSADLTMFRLVTLSTLFDWRGGNIQSNQTESFRCQTAAGKTDRGCYENMDPHASLADQARFVAYRFYGSYWGYDEKADFLKWREMSVTLNSPQWLTSKLSVARNASLTFSGRNLHTWTKYSGLDPEANEIGAQVGTTGGLTQNEFNTQPPLRLYSVRLNFQF